MGVKIKEWKGAWWLFINHQSKRRARRVGVGPAGKKAAELARIKLEAHLALGGESSLLTERSVPTFQQATERWLDTHTKLGQIRVSTEALYRQTLRAYTYPRFGASLVTAISREEVRTLVSCL